MALRTGLGRARQSYSSARCVSDRRDLSFRCDAACNLQGKHSSILAPAFFSGILVAAKLARFSWLPGGLAAALVIAVGRLVSSTPPRRWSWRLYDRVMRAGDGDPVARSGHRRHRRGQPRAARRVAMAARRSRQPHRPAQSRGARVVAFTVPFDTARRTSELERLRAALALLESSDLGDSEQARQLRNLLGESGRRPRSQRAPGRGHGRTRQRRAADRDCGSASARRAARICHATLPARVGAPRCSSRALSGAVVHRPNAGVRSKPPRHRPHDTSRRTPMASCAPTSRRFASAKRWFPRSRPRSRREPLERRPAFELRFKDSDAARRRIAKSRSTPTCARVRTTSRRAARARSLNIPTGTCSPARFRSTQLRDKVVLDRLRRRRRRRRTR